eukprot:jgi/Botrbrau1/20332/Bobra.0006s0012.1
MRIHGGDFPPSTISTFLFFLDSIASRPVFKLCDIGNCNRICMLISNMLHVTCNFGRVHHVEKRRDVFNKH